MIFHSNFIYVFLSSKHNVSESFFWYFFYRYRMLRPGTIYQLLISD